MLKEVGAEDWLPPSGYKQRTQWALDNREALVADARQIEEHGTAADQLQHYLSRNSDVPFDVDPGA